MMLPDEIQKMLQSMAEKDGMVLSEPKFAPNRDATIFLLSHPDRPDRAAAVSLIGLEQLQNSSGDRMHDLLEARYVNARKTLEAAGGKETH